MSRCKKWDNIWKRPNKSSVSLDTSIPWPVYFAGYIYDYPSGKRSKNMLQGLWGYSFNSRNFSSSFAFWTFSSRASSIPWKMKYARPSGDSYVKLDHEHPSPYIIENCLNRQFFMKIRNSIRLITHLANFYFVTFSVDCFSLFMGNITSSARYCYFFDKIF